MNVAQLSKARTSPKLPGRASRASAMRVVAFREDDRRRGATKTAQRNVQKVAEGSGSGNAGSYAALAAGFGLTAAGIAALPNAAAALIFQGDFGTAHDFLHEPLLRLLAIGLSAAAVANWVQKEAAERDEMDEDVHRRLNGGISFFAAAQIFIQGLAFTPLAGNYLGTYGSDLVRPPVAAAFGLIAAVQWWVAGRNYARFSTEGANPIKILQSYLSDATRTFDDLNGIYSTAYAFLTATFLAAGFGYLLAPVQTLDAVFGTAAGKGPEDVLVWQFVGAGLATLLGPISFSLKEAATEGVLNDPRYKVLNVGLLTASVGHVAVFAPLLGTAGAGPALPLLLGAWLGSGLTALVGLQTPVERD